MKLFTKFLFSIVSVTLIVLTVSLAMHIYMLHGAQLEAVTTMLDEQAATTSTMINNGTPQKDINANMRRFATGRMAAVILYDRAQPTRSPQYFASTALREAVEGCTADYAQALSDGVAYVKQFPPAESGATSLLLYGSPMPDGRYLLLACYAATVSSVLFSQATSLAYIIALSIIVTTLLSYMLARTITSPLEHIGDAAGSITAGNFDVHIDVQGHDELATLAASVNTMSEQLKKSDNFKNQIISNVSHNLKTPIAAILTYCELLESCADNLPPERQREFLNIITSRARTLEGMVKSMILLSKIQTGSESVLLEEIDMAELSRHAVADQQVLADSRGLTLTLKTDGDVTVTSDREKLGTVLSNIISNSIKHTPPGGSIELSVTREGGGVTVTVSDTGEGIHPDDIPHVWDRFYKSPHSELSRDDGSGIGMHIVGSIFELLGYPHYIDSVLGEGTTVTFTIPDVDSGTPE